MSEMGEFWRDVKPELDERRKKHVAQMGAAGLKNVKTLGYPFDHYPTNQQFAIRTSSGTIDYWATTGTWINRKNRKRGRGFKSLKQYLNMEESK